MRPSDRRRRARELAGTDMTMTAIAALLGVPRTTVSEWVNWPGGKRYSDRRTPQFSTCEVCGTEIAHTSRRCLPCHLSDDQVR